MVDVAGAKLVIYRTGDILLIGDFDLSSGKFLSIPRIGDLLAVRSAAKGVLLFLNSIVVNDGCRSLIL